MPIWFEVLVLALIAYAIGLMLGWMLWGSRHTDGDSK